MNLLSFEGLSKSYSEKILFDNISLGINEGEKIGIIGVNGTGKSTLLKVIAGIEQADSGEVLIGNKARIQYLSQNPTFDPEATVIEQIFKGNSPTIMLLRQYEEVMAELHLRPQDENLQKALIDLSAKMDAASAWDAESEAKTILTKLGITDFHSKLNNLSGGQRKRVAMASILIAPAELLILDEPTNHLDNETIEWLEGYLNNRKGALLMITHDRYFLDRVTNRTIELDRGKLYSYTGNYSDFLEKKAERLDMEAANESKRQNLLRKELAWMRRGAKARTTKQKARIDRFEELSETEVKGTIGKVEISAVSSRLGKKIIEVEGVSKSYGNKELIKDFSYILLRDDRIGIIGANGAGKSTLMDIITGITEPDSGVVVTGETVKVGYFSQETGHMDEGMRVIEYIKEIAEFLPTADGQKITASQMLEKFLFSPTEQWTLIGKLSGGERRRLYLLRVLMGAPNILILDEPTNDLDVETLSILEDYIDEFPGAVISVSHDRYFLDRTAEKLFIFEGNGIIKQYTGNYTGYRDTSKNNVVKAKENTDSLAKDKAERVEGKPKQIKFTFKEQKEFDEIDDIIADLEARLEKVEDILSKGGSDFEALQKHIENKEIIETELLEKMERWTYLNELAEKIEEAKKSGK